MINLHETAAKTAEYLLKIQAVKLNKKEPFTWASGWKSPIYCDNRKTLSYQEVRSFIKEVTVEAIRDLYPDVDVIAGVATGAIANGVLVAQDMDLPFVYVRPDKKGHGMKNQVEGNLNAGQKVVVVEDLISTGGSSLKAVDALRDAGAEVLGMVAIFTYGFKVAEDNFAKSDVKLHTLTNYNAMIEQALSSNYIMAEDVDSLKEWRHAPDVWGR
jgi:orotate phosphoribosyltransferase